VVATIFVGCSGFGNKQPIVLRIPETICAGEGKSLFAANQMRAVGHIVNDVPKRYGGQQCIKLHDGPFIPLFYHQGLCHMKTHFPTDDDLKALQVFDLTLDTPWNPGNEFDEDTGVAHADMRGMYQFATKYIRLYDDAELHDPIVAEAEAQITDSYTTWTARINQLTSKAKNVDREHLIPCFAWQPQSVIQKTLENTTQCYRTTSSRTPVKKYIKTRTPALRVTRLTEKVSTDFIDSSVPSINGGQTGAQIFLLTPK